MKTSRFIASFFDSLRKTHGYVDASARPRCGTCALRGDRPTCKHTGLYVTDYAVCDSFKRADAPQQEGQTT